MKYELHFRHRQNQDGSKTLNDVFETVEAKSKTAAIAWGKAVAAERGWFFMSATKETQ